MVAMDHACAVDVCVELVGAVRPAVNATRGYKGVCPHVPKEEYTTLTLADVFVTHFILATIALKVKLLHMYTRPYPRGNLTPFTTNASSSVLYGKNIVLPSTLYNRIFNKFCLNFDIARMISI